MSLSSALAEFERSKVVAAAEEDDDNEPVGEVQVSEYVVFVMALETYLRYLEEKTSQEDALDKLGKDGMRLMRRIDRASDSICAFLVSKLATDAQKKMITRAFASVATNPTGVARRQMLLRTALNRGGAPTMRAIFQTNRALAAVREAIEAATLSDADEALKKLARIPMRNQFCRDWIDAADVAVGPDVQIVLSPVAEAVKETSDAGQKLMQQSLQSVASGDVEETRQARDDRDSLLAQVQRDATEQARRSIEKSGESDEPLNRSETIGVATAAAIAAVSDPANPRNIPTNLQTLDDDQRRAAMSDGLVLVRASAGSGKTTTVLSRIAYKVLECGVPPSRILATSFNKSAADNIEQGVAKRIGSGLAKQATIGTMHSISRRVITQFGSEEEKLSIAKGFMQGGDKIAYATQAIWKECYPNDPEPKTKAMLKYKTAWAGNKETPLSLAADWDKKGGPPSAEAERALKWYTIYEGLKGKIPGWRPPCEDNSREKQRKLFEEKRRNWSGYGQPPKMGQTAFEVFKAKYRPDPKVVLNDFDDWLIMANDIVQRNQGARKMLQNQFDEVIVDEAQDLNIVQFEFFRAMTENFGDGSDGKSFWLVGDSDQCIYEFRGSRPELFDQLTEDPKWKTRTIATNYRCEPEIIQAAQNVINNNPRIVPMNVRAAPGKNGGQAQLGVTTGLDEANTAIQTLVTIKQRVAAGEGNLNDNAILVRKNRELNSYETACILSGTPYARKAGSSFMGSPETNAVLGYTQLLLGTDYEEMQKAFISIFNVPRRVFKLTDDQIAAGIKSAFDGWAREIRLSIKDVNPMVALQDGAFLTRLSRNLTNNDFAAKMLRSDLEGLAEDLTLIQGQMSMDGYKASDMFDSILGLRGKKIVTDPRTGKVRFEDQTLLDSIVERKNNAAGQDDDDDDDDEEQAGVVLTDKDGNAMTRPGNIAFLYAIAAVDPTDPEDTVVDPTTPAGFKAKMDRYKAKQKDLRTDLFAWTKTQENLPAEQRKPPPGVYLGTCHSTKGAQWRSTYVQMTAGNFPNEPKIKPGEEPPTPEKVEKNLQSERRLAYVALTRAEKNLQILCPTRMIGGGGGVSKFVKESGLLKVAAPAEAEAAASTPTPFDPTVMTPETIGEAEKADEESNPEDLGGMDKTADLYEAVLAWQRLGDSNG